jgi:histidine triad (HIT) family protein
MHAPSNYICPICLTIQGTENEHTMAKQADIVYRDEFVLVFVNSKFIKNNPGHVIVVPTAHFENIYEVRKEYLHRIIEVSKVMALALKKVRTCDGIWIEQNNEPASGQHAFHYYMHIVPRFDNDELKQQLAQEEVYVADPADRVSYAEALRGYLDSIK